jgi:hypothetical protein
MTKSRKKFDATFKVRAPVHGDQGFRLEAG